MISRICYTFPNFISTIDFLHPGHPMASRAESPPKRISCRQFHCFPPSCSYLARSRETREMFEVFEHAPACSVVSFSVVHRYNVAKILINNICWRYFSIEMNLHPRFRYISLYIYTYIHIYACIYRKYIFMYICL